MPLEKPLRIVNTDRSDGDKIIVSYSDDTTSVYTIDQIHGLTPEFHMSDLASEEDDPLAAPTPAV